MPHQPCDLVRDRPIPIVHKIIGKSPSRVVLSVEEIAVFDHLLKIFVTEILFSFVSQFDPLDHLRLSLRRNGRHFRLFHWSLISRQHSHGKVACRVGFELASQPLARFLSFGIARIRGQMRMLAAIFAPI